MYIHLYIYSNVYTFTQMYTHLLKCIHICRLLASGKHATAITRQSRAMSAGYLTKQNANEPYRQVQLVRGRWSHYRLQFNFALCSLRGSIIEFMLAEKQSTCRLGLTNFTAKFQCQMTQFHMTTNQHVLVARHGADAYNFQIFASLRFLQTDRVNIVVLTLVVCGDLINILLRLLLRCMHSSMSK